MPFFAAVKGEADRRYRFWTAKDTQDVVACRERDYNVVLKSQSKPTYIIRKGNVMTGEALIAIAEKMLPIDEPAAGINKDAMEQLLMERDELQKIIDMSNVEIEGLRYNLGVAKNEREYYKSRLAMSHRAHADSLLNNAERMREVASEMKSVAQNIRDMQDQGTKDNSPALAWHRWGPILTETITPTFTPAFDVIGNVKKLIADTTSLRSDMASLQCDIAGLKAAQSR